MSCPKGGRVYNLYAVDPYLYNKLLVLIRPNTARLHKARGLQRSSPNNKGGHCLLFHDITGLPSFETWDRHTRAILSSLNFYLGHVTFRHLNRTQSHQSMEAHSEKVWKFRSASWWRVDSLDKMVLVIWPLRSSSQGRTQEIIHELLTLILSRTAMKSPFFLFPSLPEPSDDAIPVSSDCKFLMLATRALLGPLGPPTLNPDPLE